MTNHALWITRPEGSIGYVGQCTCGWISKRSRERDIRRAFRKAHAEEAAKRAAEIAEGVFQNAITVENKS